MLGGDGFRVELNAVDGQLFVLLPFVHARLALVVEDAAEPGCKSRAAGSAAFHVGISS